jgi:predicted Zn-dependent protease
MCFIVDRKPARSACNVRARSGEIRTRQIYARQLRSKVIDDEIALRGIDADSSVAHGQVIDDEQLLRSALVRSAHPRDYALWVGLGNALVEHGGSVSPAARLAFERADALAPNHPAPRFFLGLAEARSGNPVEASRQWKELLASAPADAGWRPLVEDAVAALSSEPPR